MNLIKTQKLRKQTYRIPDYIIKYIDEIVDLGIYPSKSEAARAAFIHFFDREHKMLPEIKKDNGT